MTNSSSNPNALRGGRTIALGLVIAAAAMVLWIPEVDARGERGGGGGGGGRMAQSSVSSSNRSASANRGASSANRGASSANRGNAGANRGNVNTANANRANVNSGNRTNVNTGNRNVNTGNINTGDVNIDRDIDIDDNDWDYGDRYDNPLAAGAVIGAMAVTTAAVIGSSYAALPPNCTVVNMNGVSYHQCGSVYYQQSWSGNDVVYVVAQP